MSRHLSAWVNGVALTSAVPRAIIRDIYFDAAESDLTTGDRPGGYGQRVLGLHRKSLHVGVEFVIRELFDLAARSAAQEAAAAWAQDGRLQVSNKPERFLQMRCTGAPTLLAAKDYTAVLRADFTALAVPYWQDLDTVALSLTGSSGNGTLRPLGTYGPQRLTVTVTPASARLTTLTLTAGSTSMSFSGLSVAAGTPLILSYDEENLLTITAGGVGQLSHRSGSDDLLVMPQQANTLRFTANTSCAVKFEARGLYK